MSELKTKRNERILKKLKAGRGIREVAREEGVHWTIVYRIKKRGY